MNKWHRRFYKLAEEVATWSKDPEGKVGVVLVSPDRRQFSVGYNGLPAGYTDDELHLLKKQQRVELSAHAELNAILNARRDLSGWSLYVTKAPCLDCTKAIVQAGITTVICAETELFSSWRESQLSAIVLLTRSKIRVISKGEIQWVKK